MTRTACAFWITSLTPVPLLGMAMLAPAPWAAVFAWIALMYVTLFAYGMDIFLPRLLADTPEADEFPASHTLAITLGLAHFAVLGLVIHTLGQPLPFTHALPLFLAAGLFFGQIGNANAHELIHRARPRLRRLGLAVYVSLLFGHHVSAHRLVHHRYVASDKDPNSARQGESYYRFAIRAWRGSFRAGLRAENALRSAKRDKTTRRLHPYAIYLGGAGLCLIAGYALGGTGGALVYLGLCSYAQSQLLISDYVQHYGLRRRLLDSGRLEPVGPHHSWNAPHRFSARMMLNAPRHSDHHSHPDRAFPTLSLPASDQAPMLPQSLPAMSVLALFPPLWRRVMDPRVAQWQSPHAS